MYVFRVSGENHNTPMFVMAHDSESAIKKWMSMQTKAISLVRCEGLFDIKDLVNTGEGYVIQRG